MPPQGDDVGSRVEALLAQLRRQGGDPAAVTGEELVRLLVEFYGSGIARTAEILTEAAPEALLVLAEDPLVESQLLLHGVHPVSLEKRIAGALETLGALARDVEYLGVDADGVAHVRLGGSGKSCSVGPAKIAIGEALLAAAPELTDVEIETADAARPLLQIGLRPGLRAAR